MPEIKHVFTAGKMNKDLDERFVPNGQYRDALNIQVRTSDDGDSGIVTSIQGNADIKSSFNLPFPQQNYAPCIGSCIDEANNKAYFFFAGPDIDGQGPNSWIIPIDPLAFFSWNNRIIEYDAVTNHYTPVFNDCYALTTKVSSMITLPTAPTNGYSTITVNSLIGTDRMRPGCLFQVWDGGQPLFENPPTIIGVVDNKLILDAEYYDDLTGGDKAAFWWPEVLEFNRQSNITGINVIDDFLFWTDGETEPKKINIKRCKAGTPGDASWSQAGSGIPATKHTKLMVEDSLGDLVQINEIETETDEYIKREHVTVLRPAPRKAPKLEMSNTTRSGVVEGTVLNQQFSTNGEPFASGTYVNNVQIEPTGISLIAGDYVILKNDQNLIEPKSIRALIVGEGSTAGAWEIQVNNVPNDILDTDNQWHVELEQKKPMFELTFGRFAYRYKYEDGEYSAISPWSELAFLPDEFKFEPKNGHNLGMINSVRDLKITDFVSSDLTRPDDVTEIDILYKKVREPICYVVRTIKRDRDPEWNVQTNAVTGTKGALHITSEMIHRPLPSDQTLRAWDAVPRYAKAQTITGSRLLYGNYTQNYDVPRVALEQSLFSDFFSASDNSSSELGRKSIKSLRKYKIGIVFGDEYGRETPVQEVSAKAKYNVSTASYDFTPPELNVEKTEAAAANKLVLKQNWETPQGQGILPPDWMSYYKYYVKEISSEYYNLPMDRWYDAEDGNVWLSFYSHDRNKLDEETYIILKNQHGNQNPVEQEARYKVLAIQNEAPTFIKADGWTLGSVSPTATVGVGFDTEETFVNATSIGVPGSNYNDLIGDVQMSSMAVRYVRLIAQTASFRHTSRYVRVTNVTDMVNGAIGFVNLSEPIGPSADFTEIWTANSYNEPLVQGSFQLEFKQEEITNKPEFEGRFFVKIHRDDALDANVLNDTGPQDAFWSEMNAFSYTYLAFGNYSSAWDFANNNSPNPGVNGSAGNQPYHNYIIGVNNGVAPNDGSLVPHYTNFLNGDAGFDFGPEEAGNDHHINNFAHCDSADETRAFWINWNDHKSTTWFIDQSRFAPVEVNDNPDQYQTFGYIAANDWNDWELNGDGNPFHSKGLHNSGATGDHDMLFFGCKGFFSELSSADKSFSDTMQTDGTYFMFQEDPNQVKYRVTGSSGIKSVSSHQKSNCNNCDSSHYSCTRSTFWIKFRRVNESTASIMSSGLDVSVWDPRSVVTHDGQIKSTIKILAPFAQSSTETSAIIGNAIWETEPKETADIDLYYEASNALPLRLDSNNIVDYAPKGAIILRKKSTVGVEFGNILDVVNLYTETVNLSPAAVLADHFKGAVQFNELLSGAFGTTPPYNRFLIGDELTLLHPDGVETNLKIKDYLTKQSGLPDDLPPIPTDALTVSLSFVPGSAGGNSIVLVDAVGTAIDFITTQVNTLNNDVLIESTDSAILGVPRPTYVATVNSPTGLQDDAIVDATTGTITLTNSLTLASGGTGGGGVGLEADGGVVANVTLRAVGNLYEVEEKVYESPVKLAWHNCWSFGNGVESNRIRDDFNAQYLDNGAKASTVLENYGEQTLSSGITYSGLYNGTSGLNALNEFNAAVQITKNLNPSYGSIQALKTRDTNVLAFCEDKILKILANKDAVFNADGNAQLTATNRVLGQTIPFAGDYGISKNPESLAEDQFRYYFTDKQRGAVLRLSNDGLTPISNVGMRDFFMKNMKFSSALIGSFDGVSGEYNLSMLLSGKTPYKMVDTGQLISIGTTKDNYHTGQTITFNEAAKGWISFKSFVHSAGETVSGRYLTTGFIPSEQQKIWAHYVGTYFGTIDAYNQFYGASFESYIDVVFNDDPSTVKTFMALSYEGSDRRVVPVSAATVLDAAGNTVSAQDGSYLNNYAAFGWYVDSITTDINTGELQDFVKKENKYFGYIRGADSGSDGTTGHINTSHALGDHDLQEFSFQGIGEASAVTAASGGAYTQTDFTLKIKAT